MTSQADRIRYHSFRYWVWLMRASVVLLAGIFMVKVDRDFRALVPIPCGLAALCWVAAWLHANMETRCCPENDCGDDHVVKS